MKETGPKQSILVSRRLIILQPLALAVIDVLNVRLEIFIVTVKVTELVIYVQYFLMIQKI